MCAIKNHIYKLPSACSTWTRPFASELCFFISDIILLDLLWLWHLKVGALHKIKRNKKIKTGIINSWRPLGKVQPSVGGWGVHYSKMFLSGMYVVVKLVGQISQKSISLLWSAASFCTSSTQSGVAAALNANMSTSAEAGDGCFTLVVGNSEATMKLFSALSAGSSWN